MTTKMSKEWRKKIEEIAEDIVYDLEGDVLDRKGLGDQWDTLDRDTVYEIKDLWKEIIIEKLEKAFDVDDIVDDRIDSDYYSTLPDEQDD